MTSLKEGRMKRDVYLAPYVKRDYIMIIVIFSGHG
jgi:hypothetical protein